MTKVSKDALIKIVQDHYSHQNARPLYLSTVGQLLERSHREALVAEHESLANAIRSVGSETLTIIHDSTRPGRTAVALPNIAETIEAKIANQSRGRHSAGGHFTDLPLPLQVAFCVSTENNETVSVRVSPPVRYRKLALGEVVPVGFKLIEGRFRTPGLKLESANAIDLERLWANYLAWAAESDVATEPLTRRQPPENSLERFLAAQDPEVMSRIVLTADIVAILARHS